MEFGLRIGRSPTVFLKLPCPFEIYEINNRREKAAFIQAAFAGFSALLPRSA
jgi:hypothetical protein